MDQRLVLKFLFKRYTWLLLFACERYIIYVNNMVYYTVQYSNKKKKKKMNEFLST